MQADISGKTALVTGASRRIGREIALALAAVGVNVAVHYNTNEAGAAHTVEDVTALGVSALSFQANLIAFDECDRLVREVEEGLGSVDILVNNASLFDSSRLDGLAGDPAEFQNQLDQMVGIHMRAPLRLGAVLGQRMKARGWGRIINITDRLTVNAQAHPNRAMYVATKYGLHGVSQALAGELAPEVTVNCVAPGFTLAPPGLSDEQIEKIVDRMPLKHSIDPKEIASDVVHLVKSTGKTGSTILTDGGVSRLLRW